MNSLINESNLCIVKENQAIISKRDVKYKTKKLFKFLSAYKYDNTFGKLDNEEETYAQSRHL